MTNRKKIKIKNKNSYIALNTHSNESKAGGRENCEMISTRSVIYIYVYIYILAVVEIRSRRSWLYTRV